jgi:hypothetical protein
MRLENIDLDQLKRDVLDHSPSAALPFNLSDRWLDAALHSVEQVINPHDDTDSESVRIPLSLVLHLLNLQMSAEPLEMSDEELFHCIKLYRFELAMEKLRRWGVCLTLPATEGTIFTRVAFGVP